MQNVREEVILRILMQESLNLKLWFERYECLKFWGLFCKEIEVRDFSRIIFQILGAYLQKFGLWANL
jgi:hypothetical protein